MGIRMAMGAAPRTILGLVLGRSARTAGMGLALGAGAALLLARAGMSLLYGVAPTDPLVFTSAAAVLATATSWLRGFPRAGRRRSSRWRRWRGSEVLSGPR